MALGPLRSADPAVRAAPDFPGPRRSALEEGPLTAAAPHAPVLLDETLELLTPRAGATLVDGTLGPGGHTEALLEAVGPSGTVFGIDRDRQALASATERLARFGDAFRPLHGDHRELRELLAAAGLSEVDGLLLDFGLSSLQLDDPGRGFSFSKDGPLDMRMDRAAGPTAAELLASASEEELRRILWSFGEERFARAIARAIVRRREQQLLTRTGELSQLVQGVLGGRARRYRIHPATRTFQALRIAVNRELEYLAELIDGATAVLRRGGRLALISYHSLEDREVKRALRSLAHRCTCPPRLPVCGCGREDLLRGVTGRPVRPSDDEVARNPRARSARLRVAERL